MGRRRGKDADSLSSIVQTLDRGITALEIIAKSNSSVDVSTIAERMGVSKSVAYRLVRTLEARDLIRQTSHSRYEPGLYLRRLGASSYRPLKEAASRPLRRLADAIGHTTYIATRDGDEMKTIFVQEPSDPEVISYRPSVTHPTGRGSTWVALRAAEPTGDSDTRAVIRARETGYAFTTGEVIPGLSAVSSAIILPSGDCLGVLSAVFLNRDEDIPFIGRRVMATAQIVGDELEQF